jgi:hypothetical protein
MSVHSADCRIRNTIAAVRRSAFAAALLVAASAPAQAQSTPTMFLEGATMSGAGTVARLLQVPVRLPNGTIVYKNITIGFTVSSTGAVRLAPGSPVVTSSPRYTTAQFIAGRYKMGSYYYRVAGPGVGPAGRTTWSITGEGTGCQFTAGWTSGPIAGHPQKARLDAAKITFAGYSYGTSGKSNCTLVPEQMHNGCLIGAAATADGIPIFSYSLNSGCTTVRSSPTAQLSFRRCLTTAC